MSLRTAKAKRARITAEQERRRRAAWEKRFARDLAHQAERTEQCLQLLRIIESRTRQTITLDPSAHRFQILPDDFNVEPIYRAASR